MLSPQIEVCPVSMLTPAEREAVDAVDRIAFAGLDGPADPYTWSMGEIQVLGHVEGQLVSIIGLLTRQAQVAGEPVALGGVGGVATLPEWRGRGIASALMRSAAEYMSFRMKVDFGLLLCSDERVHFYTSLGWLDVAGPLVFDQPGGKATWGERVMVLPLHSRAWPAGEIDLCGLPW